MLATIFLSLKDIVAHMALPWTVEVMELCHVSPPPTSAPATAMVIPLTFFDIPFFMSPPVQRLLFYEFPHPTLHFKETIFSKLKHSLSLTLQHFFPVAGTLVCPPPPSKPHIMCGNGDSIPLILAESNGDFDHLLKNYPRDAKEFYPLVPNLSQDTSHLTSDTNQVSVQLLHPLVAIQVTIFPNSGISIGFTYQHMVGDGRAINNFIKSWAFISKSKDDLSLLDNSMILLEEQLPIHDRAAAIKDPNGLLLTNMWNQWCDLGLPCGIAAASQDKLRATFVIGRLEINKIKNLITSQLLNSKTKEPPPPLRHVTTFVATCAFIWVCLIKAETNITLPRASDDTTVSSSSDDDDDLLYNFGFLADCTGRAEFQVPKPYFGNCLAFCVASLKKSELLGENGLLMAAKAIMKEVKEFDSELLRKAKRWIPECVEIIKCGHLVTVAGSPKLRVYETDFGWGRPMKSEVAQIDKSGTISLTECRDEEGGVEVGLALNKVSMEAFVFIFELGLNDLC